MLNAWNFAITLFPFSICKPSAECLEFHENIVSIFLCLTYIAITCALSTITLADEPCSYLAARARASHKQVSSPTPSSVSSHRLAAIFLRLTMERKRSHRKECVRRRSFSSCSLIGRPLWLTSLSPSASFDDGAVYKLKPSLAIKVWFHLWFPFRFWTTIDPAWLTPKWNSTMLLILPFPVYCNWAWIWALLLCCY